MGDPSSGVTAVTVREVGFIKGELADVQAAWWRPLGRLRPRYRWHGVAILPEYALFGTLLFISDGGAEWPYARAFAGEHPWRDRINAVQEMMPSWLWELSHDAV